MTEFDAARAILRSPDLFKRFVVTGAGIPLDQAGVPEDTEVVLAEREGSFHAFLMRELSYPHMAQGKLAGRPYLVSF